MTISSSGRLGRYESLPVLYRSVGKPLWRRLHAALENIRPHSLAEEWAPLPIFLAKEELLSRKQSPINHQLTDYLRPYPGQVLYCVYNGTRLERSLTPINPLCVSDFRDRFGMPPAFCNSGEYLAEAELLDPSDVQEILITKPINPGNFYAEEGGLLEYILRRPTRSLRILREYALLEPI